LSDKILKVSGLMKYFPVRAGFLARFKKKRDRLWVRAVDGVSFDLGYNETLGLVGESGSGKTTLGETLLRLQNPTAGEIIFKGRDISRMKQDVLRETRKEMQVVFQNPNSSLDPRQRIRSILSEPLKAFPEHHDGRTGGGTMGERLIEAMKTVGLPPDRLNRFPHEFSGGQRQRIAIARALILEPELIVLDEPTSALDSSVQAQILNLLKRIQEERGMSYLFITHNVNVVNYIADRVAVMYSGKLVEIGPTQRVLKAPLHPYTSALISSVPKPDPKKRSALKLVSGEVPSSINPPSGCRFHPRCPYVEKICSTDEPELRELEPGHLVACHFATELESKLRIPVSA
jgi:oligopeptide/dipeptide ABC transporter ATP-binding protein